MYSFIKLKATPAATNAIVSPILALVLLGIYLSLNASLSSWSNNLFLILIDDTPTANTPNA